MDEAVILDLQHLESNIDVSSRLFSYVPGKRDFCTREKGTTIKNLSQLKRVLCNNREI